MEIKTFFDPNTFTLTYVVYDKDTLDAVVIDPVMDYDPQSSAVEYTSVQLVEKFIIDHQLRLHLVMETHAHADHLSGSQALLGKFSDAKLAIGKNITKVQKVFQEVFHLPEDFPTDGSQFDLLLDEGKQYHAGSLEFSVIFTPGHTPACSTYRFDDRIFTGDAIFLPDMGTGRCDFPGGSAEQLFDSITKLYQLPNSTKVYVGHDYQPNGRPLKFISSIAEEKAHNIQLTSNTSKEEFVEFRKNRDAVLAAPRLLFQSVQVNVDGGKLPKPEANQLQYLRLPINVFRPKNLNLKDPVEIYEGEI